SSTRTKRGRPAWSTTSRPRSSASSGMRRSLRSPPCSTENWRSWWPRQFDKKSTPAGWPRAGVAYIEEQRAAGPSLEQLAAVAHPSPADFARQFKRATGLPQQQYVRVRRVERAKHLLQAGTDLSLAEVAACAGFAGQSRFSRHFKRLVGVTPGRFRTPA